MRNGLAFAACAALVAVAGAKPARADLVYELSPNTAAGASDNVYVTGSGENRVRDGFTLVGASMRLRYGGARVVHALGYSVSYLRYLQGLWPDSVANNLAWLSTFNLSARWTL